MKRVQDAAHRKSLWQRSEGIVVAVSGGPDSLCLLDILAYLSHKYDFKLHVAHVNYRLRGEASDLDERLARERAAAYGLSISVYRPARPSAGNLEEKLREARYVFFERLRKKLGYDAVAVGHHEDDQAETVLLRMIRGAGLQGLSAMRPRTGTTIRPLLTLSRADILRYLEARGIAYREDESNADRRFLRNRIRHELLPYLEREFQPNIRKVLARSAAALSEEYAAFAGDDADILDISEGKVSFSCSQLLALASGERNRTVRRACAAISGRAPSRGQVDECLKIIRSAKSKHQTAAFRGLKLERKNDTVTLLKSAR